VVEDGTCWNARVTSWMDIREGAPDPGGVPPSSDLTSCSVKGIPVRSSLMLFRELDAGMSLFAETCDHTALRYSGSGCVADVFVGEVRG
jgi:hypothetical protein